MNRHPLSGSLRRPVALLAIVAMVATLLTALAAEDASAADLSVTGNVDATAQPWAKHTFEVTDSGLITASLSWAQTADLDLYLKDPSGGLVAAVQTGVNPEQLSWVADVAGDYQLIVGAASGGSDFALDVELQVGASPLTYLGSVDQSAKWEKLRLPVAEPGLITASLSWAQTADLDLYLKDPSGGLVAAVQTGVNPEQLSWVADVAGDYQLIVGAASGGSDFALDVELQVGASPLTYLGSVDQSAKWEKLRLPVAEPGLITASLSWAQTADLDLYLKDPSGGLVAAVQTGVNPEQLSWVADVAGDYQLIVGAASGGSDFALDVELQVGASPLTYLGSVDQSAKWEKLRLPVAEPGLITASLSWAQTADLDLYLKDPSGGLVAAVQTGVNPEQLSWVADVAGDYQLIVGAASGGSDFALDVELQVGASPLTYLGSVDQSAKWEKLRLPVAEPGLITASLSWAQTADLDLYLKDPSGGLVAAVQTGVNPEQLSWVADVAGDYQLIVGAASGGSDFALDVELQVSAGAALVQIDPGAGIDTSTYNGGFIVTNTGDVPIELVSWDLSTAVLPDMVFDPVGDAGDAAGKCLEPVSGAADTGYVVPGAPCVDPFSGAREGGYDVATASFTDFGNGETFEFATDVDPTTIKAFAGTGNAGSVSGLELAGSTITVVFADGTVVADTYRIQPDSLGGSQAVVAAGQPAAPAIDALGVDEQATTFGDDTAAATVADPNQTIQVTGPAGANVMLLQLDASRVQMSDPADPTWEPFDVEAYEANKVVAVSEYDVTIGGDGTVDVPVVLTDTGTETAPDVTGLNHFTAVVDDGTVTGPTSNVIILELGEAPVANDDDAVVSVAGSVAIDVLANDTDADGTIDPTTVNITAGPTGGNAQIDAVTGEITYNAEQGFEDTGSDSITYTVDDDDGLASNEAVVTISDADAAVPVYRINAGGPLYTDVDGNDWAADTGFSPTPGTTYSTTESIAGTEDDTLYQTERYGDPFSYALAVDPGTYTVNLLMAEIFVGAPGGGSGLGAGDRIFDAVVEGQTLLDAYDLFADVGTLTATSHSISVEVTDGTLNIDFSATADNAKISAIEVLTAATPNEAPVAADDAAEVEAGGSVEIDVLANDTDSDGTIDPTTVTVVTDATGGTTSVDAVTGAITYTAGAGFDTAGSDTFTYTVDDDEGATSNEATVTVTELVDPVLYRVNAGGAELAATGDGPVWTEDQSATDANGSAVLGTPSPYVNADEVDITYGQDRTMTPAGDAPAALFKTERYDNLEAAPPMIWTFPVTEGATYQVKLYLAEIFTGLGGAGQRVFDVDVEGTVPASFSGLDPYVLGGNAYDVGSVVSATVAESSADADSVLVLTFLHDLENPAIKGIEIIAVDGGTNVAPSVTNPGDQSFEEGATVDLPIEASDDPAQTLTYEATGLPAGLSIDAATGVISGTIADPAADYPVVVTVTDDGDPALASTAEFTITVTTPPVAGEVLYRVNAGGPLVAATDGGEDWTVDTTANNSTWLANAGSNNSSNHGAVGTVETSVPASTPAAVFTTERWDNSTDAAGEMAWAFPVDSGTSVEVRLYFRNGYAGTSAIGQRVFDVLLEGTTVLDNYDIVADVGHDTATMKSFEVTSDGTIDIEFLHVTENPLVNAIEIVVAGPQPGVLSASPSTLDMGLIENDTTTTDVVTLTNLGETDDPDITVSDVSAGGVFSAVLTGASVVAPGDSTTVEVTYAPTATGLDEDTLTVLHDGVGGSLAVDVVGESFDPSAQPVGFSSSGLANELSNNPTSLEFGPDDRLYVAQQNGTIFAYTVERIGPDNYSATDVEQIDDIKDITNHNDDGSVNTGVTNRQVTGLVTAGTATNPVLYVSSSDPRIGAGGGGNDTGLDTNSGVISKLTWTGTAWERVDIVRGLPRSEENHSTNGLDIDPATNTLYVMSGGHANKGAPSNNFAGTSEYYLSAAMLSVDLDAIDALGTQTDAQDNVYAYDLPTLDDPTRGTAGNADPGDPFGGNNSLNQAIPEPGGPVQIYSPGYRNAYDVVLTEAGRLYTSDNGPNGGWGGLPLIYDSGDTLKGHELQAGVDFDAAAGDYCTNEFNEDGSNGHGDPLHYVSGEGYYGGHPTPIRAFPDKAGVLVYEDSGTSWDLTGDYNFGDLLPTGLTLADFPGNPVECSYSSNDSSKYLAIVNSSTNGIAEYTASNFGGAMQGDLLTASFNGNINRYELNSAGDDVVASEAIFSGFGATPLDVTTQGDAGPFPGTVWAATYGADNITVFEPDDYDGGGGTTCTGADDASLDEDSDGFDNADEIAAGTDPCNGGSQPTDFDGDLTSDVTDPDDDNDGIDDVVDAFALDADNGLTTTLPVEYPFNGAGVFDLGFTGLMFNGTDTWLDQFDEANLDAGGATEKLSVNEVSAGDAYQAVNTQENAFQYGVAVDQSSPPFVVHSQIESPFFTIGGTTEAPANFESNGIFIGTGSQDDYLKLVFGGNSGAKTQVLLEDGGATSSQLYDTTVTGDFLTATAVDLYLTVDPAAATVQPAISIDGGTTITDLGSPVAIPAAWLDGADAQGLAVGIISTSTGGSPFTATWDFLDVVPVTTGDTAQALVEVIPGSGINASTYGGSSFQVTNQSDAGVTIDSVSFDLSPSIFQDIVFDPNDGTSAGDTTNKCLVADNGATATGYVAPSDNCVDPFASPHQDGYYEASMSFGEFDTGEVFEFSVDVDPTTIKDVAASGPGQSGSVSGLEIVGSTVTITFSNGQTHTANLFSDGSDGGAVAVVRDGLAAAPSISVGSVGTGPATVTDAAQTVTVTGPEGATVELLRVEGAQFLPAGGGFDVDVLEANSAVDVQVITGETIPTGGSLDIPVTLTNTVGLADDGDGGINHLIAVVRDADGHTGATSEVAVVNYDPALLYRVNANGPATADPNGDWLADGGDGASFLTLGGGNLFSSSDTNGVAVTSTDGTDPVGTPLSIFETERWDPPTGDEMTWAFPVTASGTYEVRLYLAEIYGGGTPGPGVRIFDVQAEGAIPVSFDNIDPYAITGGTGIGTVVTATVTEGGDGFLDLVFLHTGNDNPAIKAIEIRSS